MMVIMLYVCITCTEDDRIMNDIITFNNEYCQVIHKFKDCDYEVRRSCMEMSPR